MDILIPSRLNKGDIIGIVAPASPVDDPSKIERGVRYLEKSGYLVAVGSNVRKTRGYLAGTDEERAADLNAMFGMKDVKAIICLRGGYGTPRLLPLLDYRLISRNPKILVGYSDITALQLALWKKCRLVTFQGPMAGVEMAGEIDPEEEEFFWRMMTKPECTPIRLEGAKTFRPGAGTGTLLGGNLSLVVSVLGTPYQPDFAGSVLFLEETGEEPYRVDRMLTHLRNAGVLEKAGALVTGEFAGCVPADPSRPSIGIREILSDLVPSGMPLLSEMPFGHTKRALTLPIGVRAEVNATARTLTFLDAGVR